MAVKSSTHTFKTNFTSGELTDKLDARLDWAKHQNGARIIENFVVQSYGGITRRAGTFFIGSAKYYNKKCRLIPFEFSITAAYTVELGDQYARFYRDRALIRNATSSPACQLFLSAEDGYDIDFTTRVSPAGTLTPGATSGSGITFTASSPVFVVGDVGRVLCKSSAGDTARATITAFTDATHVVCTITSNFPDVLAIPSGSWQMSYSFFTSDEADRERFIAGPDNFAGRVGVYVNNWTVKGDVLKRGFDTTNSPFSSGWWSITGTPYEIATPYLEAELTDIRFDQSADVMYITHNNYAPRKLARITSTTFSLTTVLFNPPPSVEQPILPVAALTLGATSGNGIAATTDVAAFVAADVGRQIASGIGRASIVTFIASTSITVDILDTFASVGPFASGTWEMRGSPSTTCTPSATGPVGSIITLTLAAAGWRSTDVGKFVIINDGLVKITKFTSSTVISGTVLSTLHDVTVQPSGAWTLEVEAWSAALGYPRNVKFHQQRLFLSSNNNQPQTTWGSVTADFENFAIGAKDADAVQYTLSEGGVNLIRWMQTGSGKLVLGTVGGEYRMWGGSDKSVVTPHNVQVDPQSGFGCDVSVNAVKVGNRIMFLQRGGNKIREVGYNLDEDSFVADDVTIFAEHLTRAGITSLTYCKTPDSAMLATSTDGKLLVMTYERKEQVFAWSRHTTNGFFENVMSRPNKCGTSDEVWIIVKRTVGGATKRYIEILDGAATTDCCVIYDNSSQALTSLRGLRHINGLSAVSKGGPVAPYTTGSGTVASGLLSFSSATHIEVGLNYTPRVVTLRPEFETPEGTAASRRKRWNQIILRLYAANGTLTVNGRPVALPASGDFTGDKPLSEAGWERDGRITITTTDPVPVSILGITGAIQADDG